MRLAPYLVIRTLSIALAIAAPVTAFDVGDAWADARSEARMHFQAGVKAYNAGDYKTAIREFSQAQSLAPADLNNYNLALCYDKLGDAEPAIQYYRAYLDKQPGSEKRREIEASIKRLEAAMKSAAAKKAEEERKAEEARKAIEAKRAEEAARKAAEEAARKAAEEEAARKLAEEEARKKLEEERARNDDVDDDDRVGVGGGAGTTGTPGTSTVQTTGHAQLDRVAQIDINQIRDQRLGAANSGLPDPHKGPAALGGGGGGPAIDNETPQTTPPPSDTGTSTARANPNPNPAEPTDKPKATPVYKKWWFWAVLGVSAYVVYSIATDDSTSNNARESTMFGNGLTPGQPSGGATLFRF